ncbi:hypothetical protein LAZ67_12003583 [Cordylochernes scorpioides]|uniref:Uncharacterized protein n=1 Tax=Cordylochernes scorpioides TaxID=51811 RepID=A0ABY6L2H5_9ARAC|nr:hypothetical protein LAZ67_12003583 [Cordylochernes scorpioides]
MKSGSITIIQNVGQRMNTLAMPHNRRPSRIFMVGRLCYWHFDVSLEFALVQRVQCLKFDGPWSNSQRLVRQLALL